MQRDRRLAGLSSEHHRALVLARRVRHGLTHGESQEALGRLVREAFERELAPHFAVEEELLLPALTAASEDAVVARILREHRTMRAVACDARFDVAALTTFAELLAEHVRFEERELFPLCERVVPAEILRAVEAAIPPPRLSRAV